MNLKELRQRLDDIDHRLLELIAERQATIGGAGKMGGWFAQFLYSQGFDVEIADPRAPAGSANAVAQGDESRFVALMQVGQEYTENRRRPMERQI